MSDWPPKKNSAFTAIFPIYDNDGDLVPAAASLDSEVSKDGGTFTDVSPGEATEVATSSGVYALALSATEMNADTVATITKTSTVDAKTAVNVMYTVTRQLVDLTYPTVSGRSLDVAATGEAGIDFGNILGTLDAAQIGADAITNAKIAADAIGASELATDAVNEIRDAILADSTPFNGASIATILSQTANILRSLATGTADSGSTTTLVDAALTQADTDYWQGAWLVITSGNIAGQARKISAFTPGTDTITVDRAFTQAISTNTYEIWPADFPNNFAALLIETDGMAHADLKEWLGAAPNALVSGRVDGSVGAMAAAVLTATAIATDAITAAKIATDAIGASELAADAAIEIADAVLTRDIDNVEASMALHTLGTAILKAVSRIRDNAGAYEVYRTDGATLHMSQTITTDAGNDPIDELTVGV